MKIKMKKQPLNYILSDVYQCQVLNMPENVEFILQQPKEALEIVTDDTRLKQVINNLINNAIKFTTHGSIALGYKALSDNTVEIFVNDTGIGMSKEKLAHIFDRFYKVDSFKPGAGLGLSISKTIIEHMQGEITVTSEEGKVRILPLPFLSMRILFELQISDAGTFNSPAFVMGKHFGRFNVQGIFGGDLLTVRA